MKRWVMAVIVVAGLAVAIVPGGSRTAEAKAADAAAMYVEETVVGTAEAKAAEAAVMYLEEMVVGTVLASQKMYTEEEVVWYRVELRVDRTAAEDSTLEAGQVLNVRYHVAEALQAGLMPRVGREVSVTLRRPAEAGGDEWTTEAMAIVGRGEMVNPGEGAVVDLGSPEAKVLVKMFAPLRPACHQKTVELLNDLAAREPERVRVQLFDMARGPRARREMRREGVNCATVLVNNRMKFTLEGEEGARKVVLSHMPNEERSTYNSEDVIAVVEQEISRLYPEGEEGAEEESAP